MAEKLIVLSDMWGVKKGLWITSYFGYLQQYYDIEFYDIQQLANLELPVNTGENIHKAFVEGGLETAAAHLKSKVKEAKHILAFSAGGTIAWKAALLGMPLKSLTAISATRLRFENERPLCKAVNLVYGDLDRYKPKAAWFKTMKLEPTIIQNFGHELYSDEKYISEICMELLNKVTKKAV